MIYVYAITDRPGIALPSRRGLDDEALGEVSYRDIAAVVSDCDGAALSTSAAEVWRHEDVIEALMEARTVVPARFGTLVPSRQLVADILRRTYDAHTGDLRRVRGRVEISVRFLNTRADGESGDRFPDDCAPAETGPGSAYLRARLARERKLRDSRQEVLRGIREVYERLARHAHASRLDGEPGDRNGVTAAFLVSRERVTFFQSLIGEVAAPHSGLALLCTGPWPPYSFVGSAARARCEERHDD